MLDSVPDAIDRSGLLRQVSSAGEIETSLKSGLTRIQTTTSFGAIDTFGGAADVTQSNFTGTYTQEQNVDEFDAVKYDGDRLYIAPRRDNYGCCLFFPVAGPPPADDIAVQRSIRIMDTDADTGMVTEIAAIGLTGENSVQGLYLYQDEFEQDRLVALTSNTYWGHFGGLWVNTEAWSGQTTGLAIYDTSDPSAPSLSFEAEIEGGFIESRRIGNTVYLITRHTPTIEGLNYYVTTSVQQAENEAILASVTLDDLLPQISVNGVVGTLVDPASCYITNDAADPGYAIVTSITAVPLDDPEAYNTVCYNEDAYGVYVSGNAMYLSQYRYEADMDKTRLHKFAFAANGLDYRGSAEIEGLLWSGGQNDFRISEHDGYVRAITTAYKSDNVDSIDHQLFVLEESATSLALRQVARLPNEDQVQEIGKPNEQLYGVRFFADRAYAVTFERIDPLYVIDLSDPAQPQIAGELEVTGFSDFLHPVSAELLLGLGRSDIGGVKLELFDISDITRPLSLGSDSLGGSGSYSEARYDRHAFTYQADIGGIDRFIIPADIYATDGSYRQQGSGLYFYEIHDKQTPGLASLIRTGSLIVRSADTDQSWFTAARNRAFLHNDTVFYVRDEEVWSGFWATPGLVNGPF